MYKLWLTRKTPHGRRKKKPDHAIRMQYIYIYRYIITYTQLKNRINAPHETLKVLIHKEYYTPKELLNLLKIKKKEQKYIFFNEATTRVERKI